ncbi:uncharacterized protein PV07_08704 [Cladophialophora immunda]|uniref:Amino acid permease/ SLC12A domain-containing protein n=1 Tax=Cladophialophora immunda TaxID=569365 RepID=A0A0D2C2X4_9EURO|nr:uncharacterized protein PV07_08704 [Cladophialophora immunda]KIW25538.1 hypothetical protein PV07_08704 [Cladophialophora immunda]
MAIGQSIGTAVFVSIGCGLSVGGPGSLLIAFLVYCAFIGMITDCTAEMMIYMPVSGGFLHLAGEWVDEAWGFMEGWNFFFYEGLLIPFEITALTIALGFWWDNVPPEAICILAIFAYGALNFLSILLFFILFFFTFIAMVGGNLKHDPYGFRYWRFGVFYIGSAICVGIVIAYNDPMLLRILSGSQSGGGTAAASPYVIAMKNLGISGLPHLVNAPVCTSIFSAGNNLIFAASLSLYGLSMRGHTPKIFTKCTKRGVPMYALATTMVFPILSLLGISKGSAKVLTWLINIITSGGIINFIVIGVTYINFYRATESQGFDRRSLPYFGYFQPYCA